MDGQLLMTYMEIHKDIILKMVTQLLDGMKKMVKNIILMMKMEMEMVI